MAHGKAIELFLVNGTADSLITAKMTNWNVKAIKIPRIEVQKYNRQELRHPGVYFLFCNEDEQDSVYIGESENVFERLKQHLMDYQANKEKYYWHTAVVITGDDLTKTHIRYLEDQFVKLVKASKKYAVLTQNTYGNTVLKEAQKESMDELIEIANVLINTLGYRIMLAENENKGNSEEKQKLHLRKNSGTDATGYVSSNGFVVCAGSTISENITKSFESNNSKYYEKRNNLISNGTIINRKFTIDYEFSSPSSAASIVNGSYLNGLTEWKDANGKTMKDLQL